MQCVSVFNLPMRVCFSINLSVLLEKSHDNIMHSRSEIVWSGLLKCLATGSLLLLSLMLFCDYSQSKDGNVSPMQLPESHFLHFIK